MLNPLPLSLAQFTSNCLILLNYHGVFRESVAAFETETHRVRERNPERGPRLYILLPDEMDEILSKHKKAREEAIKATERDSRLFQEIGILKWS